MHTMRVAAAAVVVTVLLGAARVGAAGTPRIVNGLDTHEFPTTGALLHSAGAPINGDNAVLLCSGILIGCRTFLTAAHCVKNDVAPSHYSVYFQNVGIVAVSSLASHPSYTSGLSGNDVAILKLATDVTGIEPTLINSAHDLNAIGVGLAGIIVGFGKTAPNGLAFGIKRYGAVQTADCIPLLNGGEGNDKLVCWDFASPVGPAGEDSDTCNGDSGGPLFLDFGGMTAVAGVTADGTSPLCLPLDHSWDASVYFNAAWIATEIGTDSTTTCGDIGPVGTPVATVTASDGNLSAMHPSDSFTIDVSAPASVLRVALNGEYNGTFDPDLYVKEGLGASASSYDCKADGLSMFGGCELAQPNVGVWSVFVSRASGAGQYQVTSTVFAAPPAPSTSPTPAPPASCGNGVIEGGEECDDGGANGAASCCTTTCAFQSSGTACADDGNVCTLDVCTGTSAVCEHPAGNAGATCRAAVDACDAAESCDGVSPFCPADLHRPDSDGDGACDSTDPCTNVAHARDFIAAARCKLTVAKINTDTKTGNDGLILTAVFELASSDSFTVLSPAAHGARLIVQNGAGATRLDVTLAAGLYAGNGTRGWKENHKHTAWTFKDTTRSPAVGITSLKITNLDRKAARQVSVSLKGKKSTYPVIAGDEPLHVVVVLGNQADGAAGYCGESAFRTGDCAFNRKGDGLVCTGGR